MTKRILSLALLLGCLTPACGSDDEAGKKDDSTQTTGSTSVEISAADGGEVKLGDASLNIPGGALAGDTTVTLETTTPSSSLPNAGTLKGLLYDFGPDGTEFSAPAMLSLPSVSVPEGKVAVISWLDEAAGAWVDLATTTASDGSLVAEIAHFTKFVVRLNGAVTDDCSFAACGGNIEGTWGISGVCASVPDDADPFMGMCPDAEVDVSLTLTGSITFGSDGSYEKNFTSRGTVTFVIPSSCIETLHGSAVASCSELDSDDGDKTTVCSGSASTTCTCVQTDNADKVDSNSGTYTTDGSTLSMMDTGETTADTMSYCVNAGETETRVQQVIEDNGVTVTWIATKQ
jgi:hypothetical protein